MSVFFIMSIAFSSEPEWFILMTISIPSAVALVSKYHIIDTVHFVAHFPLFKKEFGLL
jgi:hypothetical protein